MSIVEERVSAPPKEREDAREDRARVLEAAALEIEVRGWCQGTASNTAGNVCIFGAITYALGMTLTEGGALPDECFVPGCDVWGYMGDGNLINWNEYRAKSADEATFLLRWRAEEIRDGR